MNLISNEFFVGERPFFATDNIRLENVKFFPGESALKECNNVEAYNCEFMCKYPFWHNDHVTIEKSLFTVYSRAAIWYSKNIRMINTVVDAPKMFRACNHVYLENTKLMCAAECGWNCHHVEMVNCEVRGGDYLFMGGSHIRLENLKLQGNYSFQDAKNCEIYNSHFDSKDAFWNSENITVYNTVLDGEYLGWHSKNLRLVNCTIYGTQPLCYATDLVMENCIMVDTDLCFEYTTLQAEINSDIPSVKNPKGGSIKAQSIGEIIIDEHCKNPGACQIAVEKEMSPAI